MNSTSETEKNNKSKACKKEKKRNCREIIIREGEREVERHRDIYVYKQQ
jgi:hypothetical protein